MCAQLTRSPTTDLLLLLAFQKRGILLKQQRCCFSLEPLQLISAHTLWMSLSFIFKFFQNNLPQEQVFNLTKKSEPPSFPLSPPQTNIPSNIVTVMLPPLPTTFGLVKIMEQYSEGLYTSHQELWFKWKVCYKTSYIYIYQGRRTSYNYLDFPLYYSTYTKNV